MKNINALSSFALVLCLFAVCNIGGSSIKAQTKTILASNSNDTAVAQPGDLDYIDWDIWRQMGIDIGADAKIDATRYTKVKKGDKNAIAFLDEFYSGYLSDNSYFLSPYSVNHYTLKLMQKLATFVEGYDPLINAQDYPDNWEDLLKITQDTKKENIFRVELGWSNNIELSLVQFNDSYLIDDLILSRE